MICCMVDRYRIHKSRDRCQWEIIKCLLINCIQQLTILLAFNLIIWYCPKGVNALRLGRSGVAQAMRHSLRNTHLYGLSGLRKGDKPSAYVPVKYTAPISYLILNDNENYNENEKPLLAITIVNVVHFSSEGSGLPTYRNFFCSVGAMTMNMSLITDTATGCFGFVFYWRFSRLVS